MTDPSRRRLLGTAGAVGLGAALGTAVPSLAAKRPAWDPTFDTAPVRAALNRLLPEHADQFRLTPLRGPGERFRVTGGTGRVTVAATGRLALLTGVHWFLKYVCGAHISWSGSQLDLPERLPGPERPLERAATVAHRFVFTTHTTATPPRTRTGTAGST